jgi:hypothetical protein
MTIIASAASTFWQTTEVSSPDATPSENKRVVRETMHMEHM